MQPRLLQLFLFMGLVSDSLAQGDSHALEYKNEVGMSLFSIKSNYGLSFARDYYTPVFSSISFKRYFGSNTLRVGVNFRDDQSISRGEVYGMEEYTEGKFNLGYQRNFLNGSFMPYIGIDLVYVVAKYESEFSGGFWASYNTQDATQHGFGIAPFLGFHIRLFRFFRLRQRVILSFYVFTSMEMALKITTRMLMPGILILFKGRITLN